MLLISKKLSSLSTTNKKMKAAVLIKNGNAATAFEIREVPKPAPGNGEVLIKVAAFGLNFADVMARNGMYKEAPPLPAILGYDVAGYIEALGAGVSTLKTGDRVVAMTRFGGYAEYAVTNASAVAVIPADMDTAAATALATQYCTAYYTAAEMMNLHKGDKVLIQSGAGGVGTALIQYATYKGCEIFSTAGSEEKLNYLSALGVHHPINYTTQDFEAVIKKHTNGKGVDAIFDAVGGSSVKKGFRSLAAGGRLVCFGAADMSGKNIFGKLNAALGFGFYHPVMLMVPSKTIIGVNMLRIADDKPEVIQRCLQAVVQLTNEGVFKPALGKSFDVSAIGAAHEYLEKRKSMGKVAVHW
jgi:NADPH:quinone reductase-like Zn-dependent oxidoreductase